MTHKLQRQGGHCNGQETENSKEKSLTHAALGCKFMLFLEVKYMRFTKSSLDLNNQNSLKSREKV